MSMINASAEELASEGFAVIKKHQFLHHRRYEMIKMLGNGVYSTVWLAFDHLKRIHVAIKVAKHFKEYFETAKRERYLHQRVSRVTMEPGAVTKTLDAFVWRTGRHRHMCLVLEHMHTDLDQVLERLDKTGGFVDLKTVHSLVKQMARGLLELERAGVLHTDLKPHNILIRNPRPTAQRHHSHHHRLLITPRTCLKIADLGNGCWAKRLESRDVQTRYYRAPEVMLGMPYNHAADMFSAGLVLLELLTNQRLLSDLDNDDLPTSGKMLNLYQLKRLAQYLGPISADMQRRSVFGKYYFDRKQNFLPWTYAPLPRTPTGSTPARRLYKWVSKHRRPSSNAPNSSTESELEEKKELEFWVELAAEMMRMDPQYRLTSEKLLFIVQPDCRCERVRRLHECGAKD